VKTSFQKLVGQCKPFVGKSSPMTDREIDIIKSAESAKGAKREREEILRIIWDAVETASNEQQECIAKALFYRIESR
jgi:hypothetical protein